MDVTWTAAEVKAIAPELDSLADATIDVYAEYAALQINANAFGAAKAKMAGIFLTAHLAAVFAAPSAGITTGGTGAATQMAVGQVSVSYAAPTVDSYSTKLGLGLSKWGIEYGRLIQSSGLWAILLG